MTPLVAWFQQAHGWSCGWFHERSELWKVQILLLYALESCSWPQYDLHHQKLAEPSSLFNNRFISYPIYKLITKVFLVLFIVFVQSSLHFSLFGFYFTYPTTLLNTLRTQYYFVSLVCDSILYVWITRNIYFFDVVWREKTILQANNCSYIG